MDKGQGKSDREERWRGAAERSGMCRWARRERSSVESGTKGSLATRTNSCDDEKSMTKLAHCSKHRWRTRQRSIASDTKKQATVSRQNRKSKGSACTESNEFGRSVDLTTIDLKTVDSTWLCRHGTFTAIATISTSILETVPNKTLRRKNGYV